MVDQLRQSKALYTLDKTGFTEVETGINDPRASVVYLHWVIVVRYGIIYELDVSQLRGVYRTEPSGDGLPTGMGLGSWRC